MSTNKKMDEKLEKAIIQMKNGDEKAFNTFYSMTYNQVYFKARQIMRNEEDALDLTQETYVIAYKGINKLENNESVYAWLASITYKQGMRIYNKNKELLLDEEVEDILDNMENEEDDWSPESANEKKEVSKIVGDIITELPEAQKAAIIAFYYDHMKIDQIAECFECSANTIKSRLNYAKKFLKAQILEQEKRGGYVLHQITAPVMLQAIEYIAKDKGNSMTREIAQNVYDQICNGVGLEATRIAGSGAAGLFGMKLLTGTAANSSVAGSTAAKVGVGITAVVLIGGTATLPHMREYQNPSTETQIEETQSTEASSHKKKKKKKNKNENVVVSNKKNKKKKKKKRKLEEFIGTYYMENQDASSFSEESDELKVAVRINAINTEEGKSVLSVTEYYSIVSVSESSAESDVSGESVNSEKEINSFAEVSEYTYEDKYVPGKDCTFNSEDGTLTLYKNGNISLNNHHVQEMLLKHVGDLSVAFPYEESDENEWDEGESEDTQQEEIQADEVEDEKPNYLGSYTGKGENGVACRVDVNSCEENNFLGVFTITNGEVTYSVSISSGAFNEKVVAFTSSEGNTGGVISGTIQFEDSESIILNYDFIVPEADEGEENVENLHGKNILLKK